MGRPSACYKPRGALEVFADLAQNRLFQQWSAPSVIAAYTLVDAGVALVVPVNAAHPLPALVTPRLTSGNTCHGTATLGAVGQAGQEVRLGSSTLAGRCTTLHQLLDTAEILQGYQG